jgi:membrane protein
LRLRTLWPRLVYVYQREIWQSSLLKDRSAKGCAFAVLRVISITITVFSESRVASRAAALSFSSLLGLGPLLAIATLVAGFALGKNDPHTVAKTLNDLIKFVAPQVQTYEIPTESEQKALRERFQSTPELVHKFDTNADGRLDDDEWFIALDKNVDDFIDGTEWGAARALANINPDLVTLITNIITQAQSGSAGAFGAFTLILIVLLLFKSVEDAFNDIWGVHQGRSILMRVVLYWTVLTLGAVLFFTAVALLGAGAFLQVFKGFTDRLPGGPEMLKFFGWVLPTFGFALVAGMLALFYRVIPNTRVFWRAAFTGALVVAALLMLNNYAAFLYMRRVVLEKSLYGSLAILPVLMFGLYVFWLYVLIGGIVSYAVQNVHFRNSQAAWSTLAESMRERLALVVFLTICRRFRECMPPISASHLSAMLKVPTQLLNECLNRLVNLKLVTTLRPDPNATTGDYLSQPSRPLNRITLYDFKTLDDNYGENPMSATLETIEPVLAQYDAALNRLGEQEFFQKNLEELFNENPFDESRPPFAMGERRPRPLSGPPPAPPRP